MRWVVVASVLLLWLGGVAAQEGPALRASDGGMRGADAGPASAGKDAPSKHGERTACSAGPREPHDCGCAQDACGGCVPLTETERSLLTAGARSASQGLAVLVVVALLGVFALIVILQVHTELSSLKVDQRTKLGTVTKQLSALDDLDKLRSRIEELCKSLDGHLDPAAGPTIGRVSPSQGARKGGTTLVIHGSNFTDDIEVMIGERRAIAEEFVSESEVRVQTPPADPGLVAIEVKTAAGTFKRPQAFRNLLDIAVEPTVAQGGQEVRVVSETPIPEDLELLVDGRVTATDPLDGGDRGVKFILPDGPGGTVDLGLRVGDATVARSVQILREARTPPA